jgi:hypothetical protein
MSSGDVRTTTARPPGRAGRHAVVLALFVILTAILANGFVRDPAHLTVGAEGDNCYGIRQLWWMKHALLDLRRSPYFDPESYYPVGNHLARAELFPATSILAIPMTATLGPVVSYNLAMYLTFVLMGFGTYLWVNQLTGSTGSALVAGVIAAFLPYRMAHALGHLDITSTHWMPWALYAFERFLSHKSRTRAAVLGLAIGLVALSAWYYAYAISLLLPLYALARSRPWREQWDRRWWTGIAVAGLVAGAIVAPFLIPYARLRLEGGLVRTFEEMDAWSLDFYAFFLPNRLHPLWGPWVVRWFPQYMQWVERQVALGYTAILLAIIGIWRRRHDRVIAALLVVWVASFLVALGPTLHFGGRQVRFPVPVSFALVVWRLLEGSALGPYAADVLTQRVMPIPLPSMFMYFYVPLTSGMRVMARFAIWTGLMTAALAGCGVRTLLERARVQFGNKAPVTGAIVATLVGLVLAEDYSDLPVTRLQPRAVDVWLEQQPPGDWSVIELPLEQTHRLVQDYYKTVHQRPTVFGSPAEGFVSDILILRQRALRTFPSRTALAMLRESKVRYVLLTPSEIPEWPAFKQQIDGTSELAFQREMDGVLVYSVH